jgi:hypothetical protein
VELFSSLWIWLWQVSHEIWLPGWEMLVREWEAVKMDMISVLIIRKRMAATTGIRSNFFISFPIS